ncbi:MAG: cation-translocating P-type ATPase [Deltaproteobacteria bacterium]|nr:cation-translocating P-type ATPase [Deltaproteobacteria bacterium]
MNWHQLDTQEVFSGLETGFTGLSAAVAGKRLEEYGPNALAEKGGASVWKMLLAQFADVMIVVLMVAAVVSGILGEVADTVAIVVIVVVNAIIGFVQEYRAEKAMEALKKMAAPAAVVIRDGAPEHVAAFRVVPGDIVVMEAGSVVPADVRLVEAVKFSVEEAALTGESVPVEKNSRPISDENPPLGDRLNMAYAGTFATYGRSLGVVVATGMKTELGKIAAMLDTEQEVKTPLQKRMASFGKRLAVVILFICVVVFGVGVARGEDPLLMLLTAVSLAVAAIPEALPAVVTISLALGARKMVRQNALMRKLPAVETLGSVTYICTDKTGTLTMNRMKLTEAWFAGERVPAEGIASRAGADVFPDDYLAADWFLLALALSNDARRDASGNAVGDPTETALYVLAAEKGFDKGHLEEAFPRVAELPFDSDRKAMTTFHRLENGFVSFTKGAPDVLFERSVETLFSEEKRPVDVSALSRANEKMAASGLRVLCLSMRRWESLPEDLSPENVENGLTLLGLAGLMDPPREEARNAVALCRTAGIHPVMITGDHPVTARAIAMKLGIWKDDSRAAITGRELARMSPEDFAKRVEDIRVYARVAPEQKLMIVKALQERGQYVAMTGDGVNDAPALKRADIGVSMGITGTDVAKEASHMILLDDNFATIVAAVREGRKIYDNIRKFVKYLLTTNAGEVWTLFLAPVLGLPIPLVPIQILYINLMTDALPALALSVEPAEKDIMERPPRRPSESIFAHGLGFHAMWVGLFIGGVCLLTQMWYIDHNNTHWQTMVFSVLCFLQLFHVMAIRSETRSLFSIGVFSNRWLLYAVFLSFALQLATIYTPVLNPIFNTEPLTIKELGITIGVSFSIFVAVEIEKAVKRIVAMRRRKKDAA